jgi:transcriptional regulator with XRE-family HTH domain
MLSFMENDGDFRKNLRAELDYQGLTVKELCAKTGIAKATLDCYLGARATMPLADAAVKIARSLGVTVEYLVSGKIPAESDNTHKDIKYRDILDELPYLPENSLDSVRDIVKTIASKERSQRRMFNR